MQSFDQSIFSLYSEGLITYDEALRWASNVDEFKLKVQGVSMTSDLARDQMASTIFSSRSGSGTAPAKPPDKQPAKQPEITRFAK
jgi:twitching motility protein PilT